MLRGVRNTTSVAVALSMAIIGGWYYSGRHTARPQTVIRVGVDHSPPFYSIAPNGSVSGLAVDVFNEAARRRGIRLQWIPTENIPLEEVLRARKADMWPLAGRTEDRARHFFVSRPWLESDYVLVSLQSHPVLNAEAAAGQIMAHARLRMTALVAQRFLPGSRLVVKHMRSDAIEAVCTGEATGALVESRVLDSILLARPPGCETAALNISALTGATTALGIIANREMQPAALEMRSAIDELVADGYLARKLDEWSPFSAEGARSVWAQQEANSRNRMYRWLMALILSLSVVLAWLAWRAFRLKRASESAQTEVRETQRRFTAFMDNSPAMSFMKDARGRILYVNQAWSRIFRRTPEECYGKDDFELWPAGLAHQMRSVDLELLEENLPRQIVEQIPVSDSETRDFLVVKFPFANQSGERFIGGTAIDITQRQAAIRDLAESESRYRELFENNPLPAWVYDRETLAFLTVNAAAARRYGWSREQFLGGMILPDVLDASELGFDKSDFAMIDAAHSTSGAWWHHTNDGIRLSVDVTSYEMRYEQRAARLMIVRDLTEQERTLEQLRVSEDRWQLALHGTGDALWDWDIRSGHVFRSPRWRSMLGFAQDEIGDSRADFLRLLHPEDSERSEKTLAAYLARETDAFVLEYRLRHKNGTWRWIMDRGQAIWDERGQPIRMAGSHTDITGRKEAEEILEHQARTDALTELPNRREFDRLLAIEFSLSQQAGPHLSICVCDLDRFKLVNDTWGHAAGDRVLTAFADTLRENIRATDIVGRVGGDEFIIAMPATSATEAADVVDRIRERFATRDFLEGSCIFHVTCSFGIAESGPLYPSESILLADADRSLYEAKESGRNRVLAMAPFVRDPEHWYMIPPQQ